MKRVFLAIGLSVGMVGVTVAPAVAIQTLAPPRTASHAEASQRPPHHARALERPTRDRTGHPSVAPALPETKPMIVTATPGHRKATTAAGTLVVASSTFTVDTAEDPTTGTTCAAGHPAGTCSLRAAVAAADADTGNIDTIVIPAGMDVHLTQGAPLDLTNSMVIEGTGATVNGEGSEVFNQYGAPAVWMNGLTITGGVTTGDGGGMYVSNGSLVLDHVTFTANAAANGGGIYTASAAQLWIDNSTFSGNVATGALESWIWSIRGDNSTGAGWVPGNTVVVEVDDATPASVGSCSATVADDGSWSCQTTLPTGFGPYTYKATSLASDGVTTITVTGTPTLSAHGNGGAVYTYGSASISRTAIKGNFAEEGAGVYNYDGNVNVTDCTITANSSPDTFGYGVALYNDELMVLKDSLVADNTAPNGADGVGLDTEYVMTIENTVFDSNRAGGANTTYGGAIYDDGDATQLTNVRITNTIVAPTNGASVYGGALLSYAYQFTWNGGSVTNQRNGIDGQSDYIEGGALYLDGSHATISDVTISGTTNNSGPDEYPEGGAIYINEYATIHGVTIADTTNNGYDVYGGAIYNDDYGSLSNVKVTNTTNHATDSLGGYIAGGVIYNDGENFTVTGLTADNTKNTADTGSETASANSSEIDGGAVYNDYESTFTTVSFTNTTSVASGGAGAVYGGAFYNDESIIARDVQIVGITVEADSYVQGGIVYNDDRLDATNLTLGNGTVTVLGGVYAVTPYADGGILYNDSQANMVNATMIDLTVTVPSSGTYAWAIENASLLQLTNTTIANDTVSGPTDATWLMYAYGASQASLLNSIVASDNPDQNCSTGGGKILSAGYNIDSGTTCGFANKGDQHGADAMVAGLANNGGLVLTAALQSGSPAIDAGSNTGCPAKDARGVTRPKGSACDIGAYEFASITRYGGADRFEVAKNAAIGTYGKGVDAQGKAIPCGCVVYIANYLAWPDALAAGTASARLPGPVLFVTGALPLNPRTIEALNALKPDQIIVMGGPASVSAGLFNALTAYLH